MTGRQQPAQRLRNKVAVVTGASQGLGEHLSMELAAQGARVVLAARGAERLDTIRGRIERDGGAALVVQTDLANEEDCRRLIDATVSTFGRIDHLVLNAGVATYGRLDELTTFQPIRDALEINLFGAAYPTFLAINHLIASKGLISYVTSGSGHLPMAGYLGYTTSKHAMNGFFEALRLEMYPHGVAVQAINPGDMHSADGAGRTVIAPDGRELKVDLSVTRDNDLARVAARDVARQCMDGILDRRREIDLSPWIQKLGARARVFAPSVVDRRIAARAVKMRSAFDELANELRGNANP